MDADEILSAIVMVRSRAGKKPSMIEGITAENAASLEPDPLELESAVAFFRAKGFEVVAPSGPLFTISGPERLFSLVFGPLDEGLRGAARGLPGERTLSLDSLPRDISDYLAFATFEEPLTFGPVGGF